VTSTTRWLIIGGLALAAVLGIAYWGATTTGFGTCANHELSSADAPNRQWRVVVFKRDCGEAMDVTTQVVILPRGENLGNRSGGIFVIAFDHGAGRAPWVEATWVSPDSLLIRFDDQAKLFHRTPKSGTIVVQYVGVRRAAA